MSDLRVRFVIPHSRGSYRQDIDITDLSPAALRLLARVEPRILSKDFYEKPLEERAVNLQARTLLSASGGPDRMAQPSRNDLLRPEIGSTDRRLDLLQYGHPGLYKSYTSWLDGAAKAIHAACEARNGKLASVNKVLDMAIDDWIGNLVQNQPADVLKARDDNGGWTIDWKRAPLTRHFPDNEFLMKRLQQRVTESKCGTIQRYLATQKGCEDFVAHANDEFAPQRAFAMAG